MICIDAEKAKKLSFWNQLPEEIKKDIELATDFGLRYVKISSTLMDFAVEYALQGLGYTIYKNKNTGEYEIRW